MCYIRGKRVRYVHLPSNINIEKVAKTHVYVPISINIELPLTILLKIYKGDKYEPSKGKKQQTNEENEMIFFVL